MPDDNVSLEEMIAIERVAQELWERATKGSPAEWQSLSVLAKQAWRNRAADRGHHLAHVGRRTLTGAFSYSATKLRACGAAAHVERFPPCSRGVPTCGSVCWLSPPYWPHADRGCPPPNSADAKYDGQQRAVQVMVSSMPPSWHPESTERRSMWAARHSPVTISAKVVLGGMAESLRETLTRQHAAAFRGSSAGRHCPCAGLIRAF